MNTTATTHQISRHLDPGEAFFTMADRISSMNFVLFAERSGHLDTERIRAGLAVLQHENPLLQARIVWDADKGLCFESAPGVAIALECHNVAADAWQALIENELSRPFAEGVAPLVRCLTVQIDAPARSVLVLCFHHAIADGRSGIELLRRLLDCIALGAAVKVQASILAPMVDVFPARYRWAENEEAAEQVMDTLMSDYMKHGALSRKPWLNSNAPNRTPRSIRLSLSAKITRSLLALCRQHGTSVHGALCAAQLLAEYRQQEGSEPSTLFLSCPVDMRPHLEPVQPATPTGLYVTLISAAFVLDAHTDFWELARQIIAQTRRQLARGEGHLFFSMYGMDDQPVTPDRMARFSKTLLSSWQNTMVSNIGPVATVESDPAVDAISFTLCPMPYQSLFTAVSTYKDQLILNVGYDAGKLSAETANALVASMREQLEKAAA